MDFSWCLPILFIPRFVLNAAGVACRILPPLRARHLPDRLRGDRAGQLHPLLGRDLPNRTRLRQRLRLPALPDWSLPNRPRHDLQVGQAALSIALFPLPSIREPPRPLPRMAPAPFEAKILNSYWTIGHRVTISPVASRAVRQSASRDRAARDARLVFASNLVRCT
jgi:hypothetical protein